MNKNYKQKFKDDVDSILNSNLNFDQIKDKIIIDDNNITNSKRKGDFLNKYHTNTRNRLALFNWKVLSIATSILLIFTVSLIYFTTQNKPDYKISPFNDKLQGAVFGKQILDDNRNNINLSFFINLQHNEEPAYFYEVEAKGSDNYYTCAYFPKKYYDKIKQNTGIYTYINDFSIIDGKLIAAYQDYFDKNKLGENDVVKWYQIPKEKTIPHQIKDYSLGLVLGSQDITFIENKSSKEKINKTMKIFYRNFYNIEKNEFDNNYNNHHFMIDLIDKNILISTENINNISTKNIREIIFKNSYRIINNELEVPLLNKYNKDGIGEYINQLNEIKNKEYTRNGVSYYTYDYNKFCDIYIKK